MKKILFILSILILSSSVQAKDPPKKYLDKEYIFQPEQFIKWPEKTGVWGKIETHGRIAPNPWNLSYEKEIVKIADAHDKIILEIREMLGEVESNFDGALLEAKDDVKNELIRNLMSINGVEGIFLSRDFISINKYDDTPWDEIKHIVISLINDFYSTGKEFVIDKSPFETKENLGEIEKKIVQILDQKIRPAVAKDGGDIKFKEFKDGVVKVQLQGSCSGCPSSTMTLKRGVQNLLCHYLPEVKEVEAI